MTDSSRGRRLMQTFRKLPKASPTTNSAHSKARSKAYCGHPILRLRQTQQVAAEFHFAGPVRRHLTYPVHQFAIDQAGFRGTALPLPVSVLFTNRDPIACRILCGLLALPIE